MEIAVALSGFRDNTALTLDDNGVAIANDTRNSVGIDAMN